MYTARIVEVLGGSAPSDTFSLISISSATCGEYFRFNDGERAVVMGSVQAGWKDLFPGSEGAQIVFPNICSNFDEVFALQGDSIRYVKHEYYPDERVEYYTLDELRLVTPDDCPEGFPSGTREAPRPIAESPYRLSPTVTTGPLTLARLDGSAAAAETQVQIYDGSGGLVASPPFGPYDASSLPAGTYAVLVRDERGSYVARFVRQ